MTFGLIDIKSWYHAEAICIANRSEIAVGVKSYAQAEALQYGLLTIVVAGILPPRARLRDSRFSIDNCMTA